MSDIFYIDMDAPKPRSPFTGQPATPGPVLAVKLDNHRDARPHVGLEHADIVFVEQVEGGLSRLMAVYASVVPGEVGPVRSARAHQVKQLAMFRRPALAYSGAARAVEELIEDSPLFALSHDAFPDAYTRDDDRTRPHNLLLTPDLLLKEVPDASYATDIGWRHGPARGGGKPTATYAVEYYGATVGFVWSADEKRWLASFDGESAMNSTGAVQLGPPTVVVQRVEMPLHGETPFMSTVGEGKATVLRGGRAYPVRWSRPCVEAGTTFWHGDGGRMPFAPGQVWVVYEQAK